ncbi:MAG: glycyl-radical enzyme activating protein [Clostridia bacterium]|nr:glycyl-radical enzyme activating protein [Clostridia bacterium]
MKTATIFEIKRFAVHDGDGIRTTVFFKGCPLRCRWCHNPEGIGREAQLAFYAHKCISCGECLPACENGAHGMQEGMHVFDRGACVACGACADHCLGNALTFFGKTVTISELMPLLLEDTDFYHTSGGGVTLSGGECLIQADFCAALLRELKHEGIHTAVDTCGFVSRTALNKVIPYTDIFLYDLKAYDEDVHIACTGQSNKIILENLTYLDACGKQIEIRIPYVPGYNADQMEKMATFLASLQQISRVRVLPYHNYAGSKYEALGMQSTLPADLPTDEEIRAAEECLRAHGLRV